MADEAALNPFVLADAWIRGALFQLAVDRLARASGIDCFAAAALLLALRTLLDWGAGLMGAAGLDPARAPGSVAAWRDSLVGILALAVALHLLLFQALTRRLEGPMVHLRFHRRYFTGWR